MSKRPRDLCDTPGSSTPPQPPSKRAHIDPGTSGPRKPRIFGSSPYSSSLSTPHTKYSFISTPYSVPSDSPTNPFGLKRALVALTLPRALGFSKHLALRFQLVIGEDSKRRKGKGKETDPDLEREDVFRIVQVPTNYTFRHLHKLILFLFAADARWPRATKNAGTTSHRRSARLTQQKSASADASRKRRSARVDGTDDTLKGKSALQTKKLASDVHSWDVPVDWAGHVFDVREGVKLYSAAYKRGVIKTAEGRMRVRLSSVRDRKLFPDLYGADDDVFAASGSSKPQETELEEVEEEEAGWLWEAEDDFTVGHVWPDGPDLTKGVIYHHLPDIAVHVTINTARVPPRKGVGNKPFVFRSRGSARGAIRIMHLAPPHNRHAVACAGLGEADDERESAEDDDAARVARWNGRDAFVRFLAREAERERRLQRPPTSSPSTTAPTEPLSSSPVRPARARAARDSSLPPSSPIRDSSSPSRPPSALSFSEYTLSLPTETPAPKHPAHARRVAHATRRLERLTRSGLAEMSDSEEEVDELQGDELFAEDAEEGSEAGGAGEVDELDSDGEERWSWKAAKAGSEHWVGDGDESDWDPFGEAEI
ncbi:hypothetical protein AcV5_000178 [Taiwanofungus camphoratus]|nr:hypothetical protein AcV5_000178 [Antrodia cinnamomea]